MWREGCSRGHLISRGSRDGRLVESAGCLGEDAAVERGTSLEGGVGLDQENALEV